MRKTLAYLLILVLLLALPLSLTHAEEERGELLITSEPVEGQVGEIVKVNFYLYPNLPEGLKLDSLSCSIKFDPEILTFGTINQVDETANLTSLMQGKASAVLYNQTEPGLLKLAFSDGYGVEAEGFWFQAEFRIDKEGATDFVINGFMYSGIDSSYKGSSFYIDPVSVGGVYTAGQAVPTDGAADETFAPLTPATETKEPATATPKATPQPTVPVVTMLPTFSARPTSSAGIVTPNAPVTPTPKPTDSAETQPPAAQTPETTEGPVSEVTPAPGSEEPTNLPETSESPVASDAPLPVDDGTPDPNAPVSSADPSNGQNDPSGTDKGNELSPFAVAGIIGGIVAVIGVGILLIVLILKRRNA